jgi:DNA mismatch repair protein MutS
MATALPLFSHAPEPARDELREKLAGLDPDALSPRDAQAMLYELKRMAAEV